MDWFLSTKFLVLWDNLRSSRKILVGKGKTWLDSESCSLLQCKERKSRHLHAQAHGVFTLASEFQRIQHLSAIAPRESNKVNKPYLSDCSAVLYLGYLRVSKISLRKECSKPTCKERQAGLHWTSCCCSLPRNVEMQHTVSWSTEQLTHWTSQCFGIPARWSTQFEVCGITFYRILPPKYTIQPLLGSIQMYFKTLST